MLVSLLTKRNRGDVYGTDKGRFAKGADRIDEMQVDVDQLKRVVSDHSEKIDDMEKTLEKIS